MFDEWFHYGDVDIGVGGDIYEACVLVQQLGPYPAGTLFHSIAVNYNILELYQDSEKPVARFKISVSLTPIE